MSTKPPEPGSASAGREGSLEAPTRHPLEWRSEAFYDSAALDKELERVFDICHGCRRCFNLCNSFPVLFDAVDATQEGEVAGVDKKVYWDVVDNCYLCDMCFMTKCPYVPPHPWNVDFPHLMLRAKAVRTRVEGLSVRDTYPRRHPHGRLARGYPGHRRDRQRGEPLRTRSGCCWRRCWAWIAAHRCPDTTRAPRASAWRIWVPPQIRCPPPARPTPQTRGRVALFATCYGNRNEPQLDEDLAAIFAHNGIEVALLPRERCCGMPRLELGDLQAVARLKEENIPQLAQAIAAGFDVVAPIPSCVLMFKQELPLMFPEDAQVRAVAEHTFDPFEYLMLRHQAGLLRTDFKGRLGKVSYHVPCHLRVQNLGLKTRDVLKLVPETTVEVIERCSGHNGTYGVKKEFRAASVKIGRPVVTRVENGKADHYSSDCPMAGHQIESGLAARART